VNGLCERCLKAGQYVPGYILHHKIELTPRNINEPGIAFGWDNLELLCIDCHNEEHLQLHGNTAAGLMFDDDGNLIAK
jgi:5-methylcytosine-specific restriction endonuclease McrA